jgi:hypothetical protein
VLQAQSKSREISGTLLRRIKSQMCLQPYHGDTNRKAGRENSFCSRTKKEKQNDYWSKLVIKINAA